jgi:uncharacterized protein (DUF885 family)
VTPAADPTTLDQLADDYWNAWLARHPTFATSLGERRFDDRLEDDSAEGREAWRGALDSFDRRLSETASDEDPVTHAALGEALNADRAFLDADLRAFNVDPMDGPQIDLLAIPTYQPLRSAEEADALLARWRAMPAYVDLAAARLRGGVAEGRVGVAMLCTKVTQQLDELLVRPDADWPLVAPAEERPEIRDELVRIIGEHIRPAFERYRSAVVDEIAPHARPDGRAGLSHVPGGPEAYRALARAHTSIETGPEELHAIGVEEIRRIDAEFEALGARLLGTDGLSATLRALREDPALHFSSRAEVEAVARASLERANGATGQWFGRLPKAPCEASTTSTPPPPRRGRATRPRRSPSTNRCRGTTSRSRLPRSSTTCPPSAASWAAPPTSRVGACTPSD